MAKKSLFPIADDDSGHKIHRYVEATDWSWLRCSSYDPNETFPKTVSFDSTIEVSSSDSDDVIYDVTSSEQDALTNTQQTTEIITEAIAFSRSEAKKKRKLEHKTLRTKVAALGVGKQIVVGCLAEGEPQDREGAMTSWRRLPKLKSNEVRIRLEDGDIIATFGNTNVKHFHNEFLPPGTRLKLHGRISTREVHLMELCQNDDLKDFLLNNQKTLVYCLDVRKYKVLDSEENPQTK